MPAAYPAVPGHEIVGRVTKVGPKVTKVKPGDLAGVGCMVGADLANCPFCQAGNEQFSPTQIGTYGGIEPVIGGPGMRVMSLRDGNKKMSKSDDSDYSRINLTDDADAIAQKIRKARTDPEPLPDSEKGLAGRAEAENLINIYAALADQPRAQVIARFAGQQFSGFKNVLAELAVAKLTPIAAEMRRLLADPAEIDRVLADGAARASALAEPILADVKRLVGFLG